MLLKQGSSVSDYSFKNYRQKRSRRSIWIQTQEEKTIESRKMTGQKNASLFHSLTIQTVFHITPSSCILLAGSLTIQAVIQITPAPWISLLHSLTIQAVFQIIPASWVSLTRCLTIKAVIQITPAPWISLFHSLTIQAVIRITPAPWISFLLSLLIQALIQLTLGPNWLMSSYRNVGRELYCLWTSSNRDYMAVVDRPHTCRPPCSVQTVGVSPFVLISCTHAVTPVCVLTSERCHKMLKY